MKKYNLLPIPKDTAWERKTLRNYLPIWLKQFTDGVKNLITYLPIIWYDRNYDFTYTLILLKKKIELQRKLLVSGNRHQGIETINYFTTVCLNLIERIEEDFYGTEYFDYHNSKHEFIPAEGHEGYSEMKTTILNERFDEYLNKYPLVVKQVLKERPDLISDKHNLCHWVGSHNQERCKNLLFKILSNHGESWWD